MTYELGDIVAERWLLSVARDGQTREVVILLGKPRPFPDAPYGDYYCPYEIRGVGSEKVGAAGGVDAFQAMQLAGGDRREIGIRTKDLQSGTQVERWLAGFGLSQKV